MLRRMTIAAVFTIVIGAALAVAAEVPYEEHFDQSFPLTANGSVSLENVNGDVTIEVWDHDEVQVQAVKKASSPELLAALEIDIKATGSRVEVETNYPKNNRGGRISVEYTLMIPVGASVDSVELVNGSLRISGVQGGANIECVNGSIDARQLAGPISIESVNGSTDLWLDATWGEDSVSLEAVNGSIDVYLAPGANVNVDAETVNGKINNNLGLEVHKGKYVGSSMRGTIGSGGASVSIETVNGSISVHGS